jgi:hypothetical protein
MKKLFIIGAVAIGTLASAFPFRTSCGQVVNVTETEGFSVEQVRNFLGYVNYRVCGITPQSITIYIH